MSNFGVNVEFWQRMAQLWNQTFVVDDSIDEDYFVDETELKISEKIDLIDDCMPDEEELMARFLSKRGRKAE